MLFCSRCACFDLSELERLSGLVGRPSESHPLHNSGLLSLDPVQDKTPLYSQLLQAYKWSNKVTSHHAHSVIGQKVLQPQWNLKKNTFNRNKTFMSTQVKKSLLIRLRKWLIIYGLRTFSCCSLTALYCACPLFDYWLIECLRCIVYHTLSSLFVVIMIMVMNVFVHSCSTMLDWLLVYWTNSHWNVQPIRWGLQPKEDLKSNQVPWYFLPSEYCTNTHSLWSTPMCYTQVKQCYLV